MLPVVQLWIIMPSISPIRGAAAAAVRQGLLGDLESDLRRMMLPHTAAALRESKRNTLKDFLSVAGPLGVSHFLILTATEKSTYLRVAKTPRVSAWGQMRTGMHSW